jgi:TonB family protein
MYSLKVSFFTDEPLIYEPAVRVDLVTLPDKLLQESEELPKEEVKEEKKTTQELPHKDSALKETKPPVAVIKEPTVELEKSKLKKKTESESAIDMLRKDVAIEKVKGMLSKEKNKESQEATKVYKGNILSPGTELQGVNKMDHQDYHGLLDHHVKQFWSLPEWVAKAKLKAQVRIHLNENGLLVDAKIVKSSGQTSYDDSVMESVRKASPYPAPPIKFRDVVRVDGILLGFPE